MKYAFSYSSRFISVEPGIHPWALLSDTAGGFCHCFGFGLLVSHIQLPVTRWVTSQRPDMCLPALLCWSDRWAVANCYCHRGDAEEAQKNHSTSHCYHVLRRRQPDPDSLIVATSHCLGLGWEGDISLLRGRSNTGTGFLERWSMPQACQCLKGIWTMPLITFSNFLSALKWSGCWTRWSF